MTNTSRIFLLLIAVAITVLSGCASMSKNECMVADWRGIGFEDGSAGRSPANIGERRQACAKHGIAINTAQYENGYNDGILTFCSFNRGHNAATSGYSPMQVCPSHAEYHSGFSEGLSKFCTYNSGYDYGLAGRSYRRTCAATVEATFLNGYDAGREIFSLKNQLYDLEEQLQSVLAARESNEHQQDSLKQQLILDRELSSEDRAHILLDIDALRDQDDDLKEQKRLLQDEIFAAQVRLEEMGIEI